MFITEQKRAISNVKTTIMQVVQELGTVGGSLITEVNFDQDDTNNETQYFFCSVVVADNDEGNQGKYEALIPMLQEKFGWYDFAANMAAWNSWNVDSYVMRLTDETGYFMAFTAYPTRRYTTITRDYKNIEYTETPPQYKNKLSNSREFDPTVYYSTQDAADAKYWEDSQKLTKKKDL